MAFNKGRLKTGGREKGIPNIVSNDCKVKLALLIDHKIETLNNDLEQLKKEDLNSYLKLLIQLLPYVIAKKTEITSNNNEIYDKPIIIDWTNND
jgi:hypothetical protein